MPLRCNSARGRPHHSPPSAHIQRSYHSCSEAPAIPLPCLQGLSSDLSRLLCDRTQHTSQLQLLCCCTHVPVWPTQTDLLGDAAGAPALNLVLVPEHCHARRAAAIVQNGPPSSAIGQDGNQRALPALHCPSHCLHAASPLSNMLAAVRLISIPQAHDATLQQPILDPAACHGFPAHSYA